jgi:hypothetical protein
MGCKACSGTSRWMRRSRAKPRVSVDIFCSVCNFASDCRVADASADFEQSLLEAPIKWYNLLVAAATSGHSWLRTLLTCDAPSVPPGFALLVRLRPIGSWPLVHAFRRWLWDAYVMVTRATTLLSRGYVCSCAPLCGSTHIREHSIHARRQTLLVPAASFQHSEPVTARSHRDGGSVRIVRMTVAQGW